MTAHDHLAQDNIARSSRVPALPADIELAVAKSLVEQLRLRAEVKYLRHHLQTLSELKPENTAEERLARRVRHIARRALAGEGL